MPVYSTAVGKPRPDGRWHFLGRRWANWCPQNLRGHLIMAKVGEPVEVYRWVFWEDQVLHRICETPVHTFWPNGVAS